MKFQSSVIIPSLSAILLAGFCHAQDTLRWVDQRSGFTPTLWTIHFTDTLHGWAAGDNGALTRTTDGGAHWVNLPGLSGDSLYALWFVNPEKGWVSGARGTIRSSNDSGKTWTSQSTAAQTWLQAMWFFDDSTGIIGGGTSAGYDGVMYRTTNAGQTWAKQTLSDPTQIESFCFYDNGIGWASGMDKVLATSNGGASWGTAIDPITSSYRGYVNKICFNGRMTGFGVGRYGGIIKTENGGGSWSFKDTASGSWLEGICFADSMHGIIVGERGHIAWTNNAGATWRRGYPRHQPTLDAAWFRAVFALDAEHIWTCGDDGIIMRGGFVNTPVTAQRNSYPLSVNNLTISHQKPNLISIRLPAISGFVKITLFDLHGRMIGRMCGSSDSFRLPITFPITHGQAGVLSIEADGILWNKMLNW